MAFPLSVLATSLLLLRATVAQMIISDTSFYGQSPSVSPPSQGTGTGTWAAAYSKASAFVVQLTLEEKSNLTFGVGEGLTSCSGGIAPIERLDFAGICLQDAGNGVRGIDLVNAYPSGLHVGASWNKNLAYDRGLYMGGEFRTKGVNVALGPVVGPLGRVATGGRNWEGISNDPYLCGSLAAATSRGIQSSGVIACAKHYIGNEQETNRQVLVNSTTETLLVESVSANIDDKTLHELYLWPFADVVHAGTGSIMCSYNRVNNSHSCQNSKLLNGILKEELGFQGFVVSDWNAQHSGVASAISGLDMAMPDSAGFWDANLVEAIRNGSVPESRLDDMATRIIATWYQLGQDGASFPSPGVGMTTDVLQPHNAINARDPAAKTTLLDGAIEGHVLVKNVNNALPLKSPQFLSLFGYDGVTQAQYGPPSDTDIEAFELWYLGLQVFAEAAGLVFYADFTGNAVSVPQAARNGTLISGGGSGSNSAPYISSPFDAIQQKAYEDGTSLFWDFTNPNANSSVGTASDACLVFINAFATEGLDRAGLHDDYSDALVNNIADVCNNTIVVIHNAGVRLVEQFADHPNVTAIVFAHLPGQDSGRALVSLLYGESTFSGKLPYTVPKNESDYGLLYGPSLPEGDFAVYPQSDFTEGVYIDYRYFDAKNITPRYEFGFGLSYTAFEYSNLEITKLNVSTSMYPSGAVLQGGQEDLWDVIAQVKADITNIGLVDGAEVAQLYVGITGAPEKQLRGFSKVDIVPGGTVSIEFDLMRRDLSVWDVKSQAWQLQSGSYQVFVGSSSRQLRLTGTLQI